MIFCSGCGTENQDNSKFCQNCGSSLVIQSNVVKIEKDNTGERKALYFESREERFRKAKQAALKAIKEKEIVARDAGSTVVYIGEKIL